MPVSPVTTVSPAFCANKTKNKKLKVKTALKTAGVLAAVGVAAAYGAGKGKGGFVDAVIAELQPVKKAALTFISKIFNRISG